MCERSFPLRGNVIMRLDSGLRRAASGVLPSRCIQDFLSINDGSVGILPKFESIPFFEFPLLSMLSLHHATTPSFRVTSVIYGHAYRDVGGRAASGTSRRGSPVCGERARLHGCRWQSGVWNRPPRMPIAARRRPACKEEVIPASRECDCATGFRPSPGSFGRPALSLHTGLPVHK